MRPRKQRNFAQKIDLSHTTAFRKERQLMTLEQQLRKRNLEEIKAKRLKMIEAEIHSMFRSLGTVPDRFTPDVKLAPTKEIKITVKTFKYVPSQYRVIKNAMMETFESGKNFVRKAVFYRDTYVGIDWDAYSTRSDKRPEEVFESLKECYIIK